MHDHGHDHGHGHEANPSAGGGTTAIDPVCGMTVDPEARPDLHVQYEGTSYWFCGKGCMLEFRDSPATYLDPGYTPQGM